MSDGNLDYYQDPQTCAQLPNTPEIGNISFEESQGCDLFNNHPSDMLQSIQSNQPMDYLFDFQPPSESILSIGDQILLHQQYLTSEQLQEILPELGPVEIFEEAREPSEDEPCEDIKEEFSKYFDCLQHDFQLCTNFFQYLRFTSANFVLDSNTQIQPGEQSLMKEHRFRVEE